MASLKLLHVSDFHFLDEQLNLKALLKSKYWRTKRFIDWANCRFKRSGEFSVAVREALLRKIADSDWDYLIISGDITSLGTEREFEIAHKALSPVFNGRRVIITPGNHDRYVRQSLRDKLLEQYFGNYLIQPNKHYHSLPILHLNDEVAVMMFDMALPRGLFSSRGKLIDSISKFENAIKQLPQSTKIKIGVGHYPTFLPKHITESYLHRLSKRHRVKRLLLNHDFKLYLHGHIHKSWSFQPNTNRELICVNSGGCCRYGEGEYAGFHEITIDDEQIEIKKHHLRFD